MHFVIAFVKYINELSSWKVNILESCSPKYLTEASYFHLFLY